MIDWQREVVIIAIGATVWWLADVAITLRRVAKALTAHATTLATIAKDLNELKGRTL